MCGPRPLYNRPWCAYTTKKLLYPTMRRTRFRTERDRILREHNIIRPRVYYDIMYARR